MKVNLRFSGALAMKAGKSSLRLEIQENATLANLLSQIFEMFKLGSLKNGEEEISPGYLRIYLNGRSAPLKMVLHEDDEILFLSPVAGG